MVFWVQGTHDAHVLLSDRLQDDSNVYAVVIGGLGRSIRP